MARGDDTAQTPPSLRKPGWSAGYWKPITFEESFKSATEAYLTGIREFRLSYDIITCKQYARREVEASNPARLAAIDGLMGINTDGERQLSREDPEHLERKERFEDMYVDYLKAKRQEFIDSLTPEEIEKYEEYADSLLWDESKYKPWRS